MAFKQQTSNNPWGRLWHNGDAMRQVCIYIYIYPIIEECRGYNRGAMGTKWGWYVYLQPPLVHNYRPLLEKKQRSISTWFPFHMSTGFLSIESNLLASITGITSTPLRNAGFLQLENAHMPCPLRNCVTWASWLSLCLWFPSLLVSRSILSIYSYSILLLPTSSNTNPPQVNQHRQVCKYLDSWL